MCMDMDAKIKEVVWNTIPDESEYIVGFANLEGLLHQRFRAYEYGISIGKKLDDAIIDGIAEGPTHEYFHLYHETNQHLTELVNTIVECLRALNIASLGIVTLTDLDRTDDYEMTLRPALSHT